MVVGRVLEFQRLIERCRVLGFQHSLSPTFPLLLYRLKKEGPVTITGVYGEDLTGYRVYKRDQKFTFKHGGVIPRLELAYETWGELNEEKTNAVLLHTGLSGSSHAKSHKV